MTAGTTLVCDVQDDRGDYALVPVPRHDVWVIWSYEHRAWWGPAFAGYTPNIVGAGVYTEAAARDEARDPHDEQARRLVDVLGLVLASAAPNGPTVAGALGFTGESVTEAR